MLHLQRKMLAPAVAAALLALGGCATRGEQLPWRIEPVQAVTHGLAASAQGYYVVGRQIERSHDWLRAADAYRQALQLDPGHVDARNALAVALVRLGLMPDAEAQLRMALQAAPQRADLHSNLGYLLLLSGRAREAQEALHAALALDPQDRVAQANLELAQGRAAASTVPGSGPVDTAATATAAAATKQPTAAVPAASAPPRDATAPALQVVDGATLAPLVTAVPGFAPVVQGTGGSAAAPMRASVASGTQQPAATTASQREAPPAAVPPSGSMLGAFTLEVSNGMGRRGAAQVLRRQLQQRGFEVQQASNLRPYQQAQTVVLYRPGQEAAARQVARALPLSVQLQPAPIRQRAQVRVVIGHDWPLEAAGTRVAAASAVPASPTAGATRE